ncbi:hypothetical protein ACFB49_22770 [Sphingomonas sp. DBB INV C78]
MARLDEQSLALHFEVALTTAAPQIVAELAQPDRYRRLAAVATLAHLLAERMNGFEVIPAEGPSRDEPMPLFPDLGSVHGG